MDSGKYNTIRIYSTYLENYCLLIYILFWIFTYIRKWANKWLSAVCHQKSVLSFKAIFVLFNNIDAKVEIDPFLQGGKISKVRKITRLSSSSTESEHL